MLNLKSVVLLGLVMIVIMVMVANYFSKRKRIRKMNKWIEKEKE
jgi:uncharacterized membrane protein